jgi:hypothetical protein
MTSCASNLATPSQHCWRTHDYETRSGGFPRFKRPSPAVAAEQVVAAPAAEVVVATPTLANPRPPAACHGVRRRWLQPCRPPLLETRLGRMLIKEPLQPMTRPAPTILHPKPAAQAVDPLATLRRLRSAGPPVPPRPPSYEDFYSKALRKPTDVTVRPRTWSSPEARQRWIEQRAKPPRPPARQPKPRPLTADGIPFD